MAISAFMVATKKVQKGPRAMQGGRSVRYAERHAARGHVRANAPAWSDTAASAVLKVLREAARHFPEEFAPSAQKVQDSEVTMCDQC